MLVADEKLRNVLLGIEHMPNEELHREKRVGGCGEE
jgi:hypothetical protein